MKRIYAAIVLALLPGLAAAQAEVYGQVNLSLDGTDDGIESRTDLYDNESRVGVRGVHALGRGHAFFQLEAGVDAASGDSEVRIQDSFVGIQGGLGLLRAGHFDTPMKAMGQNVDLFANQLGSARNLTRNQFEDAAATDPGRGFDESIRNGVHYRTPPLGNWVIDVHYGVGGDRSDQGEDDDEDVLSMALSYGHGGMYLGWAREEAEQRRADRFAWGYEANAVRAVALYQRAHDPDDTVWGVGLRYRPGSTAYRIQYYRLAAEAEERDAEQWAVGVELELSPNFSFYWNYAWINNESAQRLVPYREGRSAEATPAEPGARTSGWSLGASYRF